MRALAGRATLAITTAARDERVQPSLSDDARQTGCPMSTSRYLGRFGRKAVNACVFGVLLTTGCTYVGPKSIRSGRLAYNAAINETDNQQMLMAVIHNRYEERASLLAVASVTANVSVTTSTGIQLGFGDSDNYAGGLVPFSLGAIYEENPTISYTPVDGAQYVRQLMSPLPVSVLAVLTRTITKPAPIYMALVSNMNGIFNPDFLYSSDTPDPRFSRVVTIMTELTQAHRLNWVENPQRANTFSIAIDHYAPTYVNEVGELLDLLGLPAPDSASRRVILPVSLALDGREIGGVGITTRSVFDLVEILSAAIELPEEDQRNEVTASYPPSGVVGAELHVRYAEARPEHAHVAVRYRDGWFYIDERDQATKRFFRLLGSLWSVNIAESVAGASAAPVLTVPVSR
jgi:hypothetical protein